ncbi:MAG TPA: tetratricopeptide repeat protein, partial [Myxococcota bacterium]
WQSKSADPSLMTTERPAVKATTKSAPAPVVPAAPLDNDGFEDFNLPDDVAASLRDPSTPGFPPVEPDGFDALDPLATGTFGRDLPSSLGDVPSLESMDADAVIEVSSQPSRPAAAPIGSDEDFPADDAGQMSAVRELFVPERGFEDDPANTFFPDELAEAEFFIQQDLLDEAREILEPILEEIEDSERVKHMLARVAAKEAGEPEPPAPWEQRLIDDVAAEIDELAAPPPPVSEPGQVSVEEVLSQFKRGIAETVPEDDAATHYDLGIAYREMGLLDDAVGEFEVAARAASRAPDALFLIGLVRLDQSRTAEALKAFDTAIDSPAATKAQRAAAEYQRGVVFADVVNDAKNGLIAFKRSKLLGGSAPDLERRIQTLITTHGDVEVPPGGRQKNIDYV